MTQSDQPRDRGICGAFAPTLFEGTTPICTLMAEHPGWHGDREGMSWAEGYAPSAVPAPPPLRRGPTQVDVDNAWNRGYERGIAEGRAKASAFIANEIRAELVCSDVYDRLAPIRARMDASDDGGIEVSSELETAIGPHDICYWGEAAAGIADPWSLAEEAPDA